MNLKSIHQIALTFPGGNTIPGGSTVANPVSGFKDLASLISPILNIIFYVATFLAFYYLIWGGFMYIMAQGKKEDLAKARAKITWALIGLLVIFLSFSIAKFGSEIFPPDKGGLPF